MERFFDHHPILLEFEMGGKIPRRPFKFNQGWMKVVGFKELINKVWNNDVYPRSLSPMDLFTEKLCRLKIEVRVWGKARAAAGNRTQDRNLTLFINREILGPK